MLENIGTWKLQISSQASSTNNNGGKYRTSSLLKTVF